MYVTVNLLSQKPGELRIFTKVLSEGAEYGQ